MADYDESYYSRGRTGGTAGSVGRMISRGSVCLQAWRLTAGTGAGKVLEIGFGDGSFLEAMAGRGWEACGIDISDEAVALAGRRRGIDVKKGELPQCGFEDSSFDLVVMRHVLEHIPDPEKTLLEARRILRPGGALFPSVPNVDSIEARIGKEMWFHRDPEYHVNSYTPYTIRKALLAAGFSDVRISHFSLEYRQTLTYAVFSRLGLDRVVSKGQGAPAPGRLLLYMSLPAGVVLSFVCSLMGKGGTMEVTAR